MDRRETLTQTWQRRRQEGEHTGTLEDGEAFTDAHYVNCVRSVAMALFEKRLLSPSATLDYIQRATDSGLGKSSDP